LRTPYARDFVYRFQHRRGFGRLTMHALHADEEWFCIAAWRHIAAAARRPDVVHAHALHQAARLRRRDIPVVINLPGAPNPRYVGDLQQADALVADGWAAEHLPASLGPTVERVPKGVDADRFSPAGPSERAVLARSRASCWTVARLVRSRTSRARRRRRHPPRVDGRGHLVVDGDARGGAQASGFALRARDAVTFVAPSQADTPRLPRRDVPAPLVRLHNSPNVVLSDGQRMPVVCRPTSAASASSCRIGSAALSCPQGCGGGFAAGPRATCRQRTCREAGAFTARAALRIRGAPAPFDC
jgi:hypothetical protein